MSIISFIVKKLGMVIPFTEDFNGTLNTPINPIYWVDDYKLNPSIRTPILLNGSGSATMNFTNTGDKYAQLFSNFTIDGDFDVQVKFTTDSIQSLHFTGCILSVDKDSLNRMYVARVYQTTGGQVMKIFILVNNVIVLDTYVEYTGTSDLRMRISRSGSTWTGYYWNGSSWTSLGSSAVGTGRVLVKPLHYSSNTSAVDWTSYMDYINISQGTPVVNDFWLQANSGASARRGFDAIEYNGNMYIFGGHNGSSYLNDVWEFNTDTSVWTQKTSGSVARYIHSQVYYNGNMYIFGGYTAGGAVNDVWEYNLSTNTWTQKTSGASVRYQHSAIEYNGNMYIFGGSNGSSLNDVWEYNLSTNTWTQKTSGASVRYAHSAIQYNGKMYIFGGHSGSNYLNDMWEYNLSTNTWTQKTSGASVRSGHAMILNNGKIYIFGGYNGTSYLNDMWEYNISSDSWSQRSPIGWPSNIPGRHIGAEITYNGLIYYFGGINTSHLNDIWRYKI